VQQQHFETAFELATFTCPQGLNLLGDVLQVGIGNLAATQQPSLKLGPGMKVVLVEIVLHCQEITL
jgi:hypothetical protein